jgi:hypothetical protein
MRSSSPAIDDREKANEKRARSGPSRDPSSRGRHQSRPLHPPALGVGPARSCCANSEKSINDVASQSVYFVGSAAEGMKDYCQRAVSCNCWAAEPWISEVILHETRCTRSHGCARHARSRPREPRRRLRQRGLPSGMRRTQWGGGCPQVDPRQTWGLLRQGGQPGGMRRTQWGRGCQKAILAPWGDSTGGHQRVGPPPSCCAFGLVGILL